MKLSKFESIMYLLFADRLNTLNKTLQAGNQEEILKSIEEYGNSIFQELNPATLSFLMGTYITKMEDVHLKELKQPTPFHLTLESRVREAVDKNFPDGKSFSQRIWGDIDLTKQELARVLNEGLSTGTPMTQVATEFSDITGKSFYNCRRIVRTEMVATMNVSALDSYRNAGIEQVVVLENQRGSCPICSPRDGRIIDIKDARVGITIPPFHPFCRGSIRAKKS